MYVMMEHKVITKSWCPRKMYCSWCNHVHDNEAVILRFSITEDALFELHVSEIFFQVNNYCDMITL
jgi:hypothetical protein